MSIETYQFNLPITPGAIPPVLHLSQYDSGRTFTAILRDDANVPFELDSGATAVIKGRNAAGIAWQQDCTVSGANVTFTPSGAATDQFGVMPVTIEITESEEVISPLCVVFHIQKAGYTNEEAVLSPDFETAIQAAVAQAISEGGLGFSDEFKEALLDWCAHTAWDDTDGQDRYDALEAALYPQTHVTSITAAYDQDRPIYDSDSAEDNYAKVKLDLIVTALYSDGTSETVTDYTLSGTFTAGTSTITVSYQGKTAEIEVTVTAPLYSVPDFAEQSLTSGGKTITVKKENGVFTISGTFGGVVYINASGVASLTRPTTEWLSTLSGKALLLKVKDITWNNPTSTAISFDTKMSRSDQDGNLYSASFAMSANESGTDGATQYAPSSGTISTGRSISALAFQFNNNPGSSANVSASFKVELFVDNVRYL